MSGAKNCQSCKQSFEIAPEDGVFYAKMQVPPPTWCPECRAKRRLCWRGERMLYKKKSDATGKEIFSMFHPASPYKIYENEYWNSDAWDPMQYGRDIDWSRPFLEQLHELDLAVPKAARSIQNFEKSDYSNNATNLKNCYLVFAASDSENSLYCTGLTKSRDCVDCGYVFENELCYGNVMCDRCYRCFCSVDCSDCNEVILSKNLLNCSYCFGCVNLRNKQYCIFNEQYTKGNYEIKLASFGLGAYKNLEELTRRAYEFWLKYPMRFTHSARSENVTGEYIFDSADIHASYAIFGSEHCKYCTTILPSGKDCYDYAIWGNGAELVYETSQCGNGVSRLIGCFECFPNCTDLFYTMHSRSSSNLFGCVGLRNKKFCILNKQYSEDEYRQVIEKLQKHMETMPYTDSRGRTHGFGDFYPSDFSPYAYNETIAYELYPLTKDEIIAQGFRWRDPDPRAFSVTVAASALPDNIEEVADSILEAVIGCEHEGRCDDNCTDGFKLLPQELAFYRKHGIPLPRLCSNCRHRKRIYWRNPARLFSRQCQCAGVQSENSIYKNTVSHFHGVGRCSNSFQTTYTPDRKEIIYCEQCYKTEVI